MGEETAAAKQGWLGSYRVDLDLDLDGVAAWFGSNKEFAARRRARWRDGIGGGGGAGMGRTAGATAG